jgi:hypothetical protein
LSEYFLHLLIHAPTQSAWKTHSFDSILAHVLLSHCRRFDSPSFDAVAYVNAQFPTEASVLAPASSAPDAASSVFSSPLASPAGNGNGPTKLAALTLACKRQVRYQRENNAEG